MSRYGAIPDMSASYGNCMAELDAKEGDCMTFLYLTVLM